MPRRAVPGARHADALQQEGAKFDQFVKGEYIVVCQDARGRFQSDGQWGPFVRFKTHDAGDGYDTVEWAAKLSGSTGKVVTFGLRQILGHHERRQRGGSQYVRQRRSKAAMAPAVPL